MMSRYTIATKVKRHLLYVLQFVELCSLGLIARILFKRRPHSGSNRKILIFRTDAIGDFILAIPAIKRLRELYGGDQVFLLVHPAAAQLARSLDISDEIWAFERERFLTDPLYHFRILSKVRRAAFDVAICLNYSREMLGDEVIHITGAPQRIGWDGNGSRISPWLKIYSDSMYTTLLSSPDLEKHEKDRNNEFAALLGAKESPQAKSPSLRGPTSPQTAAKLLKDWGLVPGAYCVVAPGSRIKKKVWSPQNFGQVIDWLHLKYDIKSVIVGPPDEYEIANQLTASCSVSSPLTVVGKTSFWESIALIEHAKVVVANDNAAAHVATDLDVKMVALLGGGQFGRFAPYGNSKRQQWVYKRMECYHCDWVCKYKSFKCIQDIAVEEVKGVLSHLLR